MSDTVIVAIAASLPPTIVALAALWKVVMVHKELNSRLTEWKEETKAATLASNIASKAEGMKEQKEKDRPK